MSISFLVIEFWHHFVIFSGIIFRWFSIAFYNIDFNYQNNICNSIHTTDSSEFFVFSDIFYFFVFFALFFQYSCVCVCVVQTQFYSNWCTINNNFCFFVFLEIFHTNHDFRFKLQTQKWLQQYLQTHNKKKNWLWKKQAIYTENVVFSTLLSFACFSSSLVFIFNLWLSLYLDCVYVVACHRALTSFAADFKANILNTPIHQHGGQAYSLNIMHTLRLAKAIQNVRIQARYIKSKKRFSTRVVRMHDFGCQTVLFSMAMD